MNGGPFGPDLFDPKPAINQFAGQRPAEVRAADRAGDGRLAGRRRLSLSPAARAACQSASCLPRFAERIDDVCVLRSVYTDNPNHGPASI